MTGVRSDPRPAQTADLPEIVDLLERAGLPLQGLGETSLWVAVADDAGGLAGVVGLESHGDVGLLRSLAVHEEHRGQGRGLALVERVVAEARRRALQGLYLLTTDADAYFRTHGFEPTTRASVPDALLTSAEFRGACPDTATVMVLALDR